MPTVITKSIGSSGRDYSTIAAWIAAIPSSLVTADEQWIGELYNDSEFTGAHPLAEFTGKTTDATRNIILRCATGQSFKDHASKLTNPLFYDVSKGVGIRGTSSGTGGGVIECSIDYVTVIGVQVKTVAMAPRAVLQVSTGPNCLFKNMIAQGDGTTSSAVFQLYDGTAVNVLSVNTGADGGGVSSSGGSAKFHNVTSIAAAGSTRFGFGNNYDTPLYLNCASFGYSNGFRSGSDAASNYNATDATAVPGANSVGSLTFANQFVSTTADFRVKSGNGLGVGTRDQTYTSDLDIIGQTRSTTTPTIGAWEYVSGGGGGSDTLMGMQCL